MKRAKLNFIRNILAACAVSVFVLPWTGFADVIEPELSSVLQSAPPGTEVPVIVRFRDKADLSRFRGMEKRHRRPGVVKALREKADAVQKPLMEALDAKGIKKKKTLWIINAMALSATADVIRELAGNPGVESIKLDSVVQAPAPQAAAVTPSEWNLSAIHAPELWALGHTGTGAVIAGVDTGVDLNHPDIGPKWRGGSNSWYDTNGEHATPHDSNGHGTQTMGVMVGGANGGINIGVAPGASWLGVKIFNDAGTGTLGGIHSGFQWVLDPDADPTTDDAPDVVNASWSLGNLNTCSTEFDGDLAAMKDAGISAVFASGNGGPSPSTSTSPANGSAAVSVGAVDEALNIASFSSRGPSSCGGGIYPLLSAPGVNVNTADLTYGGVFPNSYTLVSGTSVAAAQVAGSIAVLTGAFPGLTSAQIESALTQSAIDKGATGPDNEYGNGMADLLSAYNSLKGASTPPSTPPISDADGDGYEASTDCNDNDASIHPGAVEVKRDGVDQDCNGYDLTVNITTAVYLKRTDTLVVEATSSLNGSAALQLANYGPMKWNPKRSRWVITVKRAKGNPGTIKVTGVEGSESSGVTVKR